MSAPKPASLTSDLLALKGQAAPAAREEDLYRPEKPSPPVVDLRTVAVTSSATTPSHEPAGDDSVPEASLSAIRIARVASEPEEPLDETTALASDPAPATEPVLEPGEQPLPTPDDAPPAAPVADDVMPPSRPDIAAPEHTEPGVGEPDVDAPAMVAAMPADAPEPFDAAAEEIAPEDVAAAAEVAPPATPAEAAPAQAPVDTKPQPASVPPVQPRDNRAMWAMGLIAVAVAAAVIWIAAGGRLPGSEPPAPPATPDAVVAPAPATTVPEAGPADAAGTPAAEPAPIAPVQAPSQAAPTPAPDPAPTASPAPTATPAATPAARPLPQAVAPSLDVVRIGGDGFPLLAGRAAPYAELIVLDNGEVIGTVTADGNGEWVFFSDKSVATGAHDFSVAVKAPAAGVTLTRPEARNADPAPAVPSADEPAGDVVVPVMPKTKPAVEDAVLNDDGVGGADTDNAGAAPVPVEKPQIKPVVKPQAAVAPASEPSLRGAGTAEAPVPYYVVQLGSLPSAADAERLWREISGRHPNLLADNVLQVQPGTLPGGGSVYRLRTGHFSSRAEARTLCRAFRRAGEDCLVVRRQPTG